MSERDPREVRKGAMGDEGGENRHRGEGADPRERTRMTPDERLAEKLARNNSAGGTPRGTERDQGGRGIGSVKTPDERLQQKLSRSSMNGRGTANGGGSASEEGAVRDKAAEERRKSKTFRGSERCSPKTPEDRRKEKLRQESVGGTVTPTRTVGERWDEKVQGSADRRRSSKSAEERWREKLEQSTASGTAMSLTTADDRWDEKMSLVSGDRRNRSSRTAEERWREKVEQDTAGGTVTLQRTADEVWEEKKAQGRPGAQGDLSRRRSRNRTAEERWREKIEQELEQDQAAPGQADDPPMERQTTQDEQWTDKMRAAAIPQSESDSPSDPQAMRRGRTTPSDRWRDKVRRSQVKRSQDETNPAVVTIQDCVSVGKDYVPHQDQDESTGTATTHEGELSARRNDEALPPSGTPPHVLLRDLADVPEPAPDVFKAELAPNNDLRPVVDVLDVAVLPEDTDEKPKFGRRDKMRLGCIAGLASVSLGVGLGVGLTRKGSGPVCKYNSPWKKVFTISHPTVKSKVQYVSFIADISRAFGSDVSLSDDGDRLAVSSRFGDGVSVYEYTGENWVQLGKNITSEEDIVFTKEDDFYEAHSTAVLSGDGNRVAVSFPYHSDNEFSRRGVVRVYEYRTGSWTLVGNGIKGTRRNKHLGDKFGVDLSTDGSIVAIGDYRHRGTTGRVRVFQDKSGNWTQLGHEMNGEARGDYFGGTLSLSGNGTTVAIGAPKHDGGNGYVRVFRLSEDVWTPGEDIYGGVGYCNFGRPVSMSANANRIAVSSSSFVGDEMNCQDWDASESNSNNGAVRVFEYSMGNWTEMGTGFVGGQAGDYFGSATSLSGDGSTLVVGASSGAVNGDDSGYARAYRHECGSWAQVGADLLGVGASDWFGDSVSLSYNGERMAVGAPTDFAVPQGQSGTATIYSHTFD